MSVLPKILDDLVSPVSEGVGRAVAEFGDDAVRSILKATPAMRKRLAALAESRMGTAAKQAKKYAANKPESTVLESVGNRLRTLFPDDYAFNRGNLGTNGDLVYDSRWLSEQVPREDYSDWKKTIAEIAATAQRDAKLPKGDASEFIGSLERDIKRFGNSKNSEYDAATKAWAEKAYNDSVLGIATRGELPNRFMEARNRGDALAKIFSDVGDYEAIRTSGPGNIVPAINQLRLQALLRMIGDAQ